MTYAKEVTKVLIKLNQITTGVINNSIKKWLLIYIYVFQWMIILAETISHKYALKIYIQTHSGYSTITQ
jgi:hypothetical protein